MHPIRPFHLALLVGALAVAPAAMALDFSVESGMEVSGRVDLDGLGPNPPVSDLVDRVDTPPFSVSRIAVGDLAAGVFSYDASADIGLLELKVFGSLSNAGSESMGDLEAGLLRASSEVRDVLSLESTLTGPYDVSFEMIVHGDISGSGRALANSFINFGVLGDAHGSDSGVYQGGLIDDTLTVTRTVSGATVDVDFSARLNLNIFQVDAGTTVTGDLGNTATFRLILPEGVTLADSASSTYGVPIAVVPEPDAWAMMLIGLVSFPLVLKRGRNRSKGAPSPL